ncbi:MAG: hypothetical protein JXB05_02455 [Myxococcaceae bacterium]|nr:hypothetical protein [Myxococcaceae bacterium]
MTTEHFYVRGALVAFSSGTKNGIDKLPHIIPFRFNPEALQRTLRVEGASPQGMSASGKAEPPNPVEGKPQVQPDTQNPQLQEQFSIKLLFDVHERDRTVLLPPSLGIAPEIAALELLMHPVELESPRPQKGTVDAQRERPTVLLVWGPRVLPVRITSMVINEELHNAFLNPVRAQVTVEMQVRHSTAERGVVKGAQDYLHTKRQGLARLFHATAAAQGGGILPL